MQQTLCPHDLSLACITYTQVTNLLPTQPRSSLSNLGLTPASYPKAFCLHNTHLAVTLYRKPLCLHNLCEAANPVLQSSA